MALPKLVLGTTLCHKDVNCAAIPETLLEVELFGFEAASSGTLFLGEIDALPLPLRSKLLGVIEEKRIRRLGAVAGRYLLALCLTFPRWGVNRLRGLQSAVSKSRTPDGEP